MTIEKLYELVSLGKSKHYLGKKYTIDEINELSEDEISKLMMRYEAIIQEEMADSLKDTFISGLSEVGCKILSINNVDGVRKDLMKDPFTTKMIGYVTSALYGKLGPLFAPITIGSIFTKHKLKEHYEDKELATLAEPSQSLDDDVLINELENL